MKKDNALNIIDENGKVIPKEEFLAASGQIYDELAEKYYEAQMEEEDITSLDFYANPEIFSYDPEQAIENYKFYCRMIYLDDEITQEDASRIHQQIAFWNRIDMEDGIPADERIPIRLYINTPGGDLNAVFSIIGIIKNSTTPIHTITFGTGYSGGFSIGICGHKRFGYPYSSFLFHEGSIMDFGDTHKFLQGTEFHKIQFEKMKKIVIDNTKISSEEYENHKKDDWYLTAEQALTYGVIDEILT